MLEFEPMGSLLVLLGGRLSLLSGFHTSSGPHRQRVIGLPLRLAYCTATIMAGSLRKRARTQTSDENPTSTTTRRSQRIKLLYHNYYDNDDHDDSNNNTSAVANVKKEEPKGVTLGDADGDDDTKIATSVKSQSKTKPKPVKSEITKIKSEETLDKDEDYDEKPPVKEPRSKSKSKSNSKDEKPPKTEDPYLERETSGYWLMKSEPDVFSYDDLCNHDGPSGWDGVRNHTAKNHLRSMKVGDKAFFYHSNCKEPGIIGVMEISRGASIDESQFDPKENYYDPKSTKANPRWYLVHCSPIRKLGRQITLTELKTHSGDNGALKGMVLFRQTRLSVGPVSADEFQFILDLENKPED